MTNEMGIISLLSLNHYQEVQISYFRIITPPVFTPKEYSLRCPISFLILRFDGSDFAFNIGTRAEWSKYTLQSIFHNTCLNAEIIATK